MPDDEAMWDQDYTGHRYLTDAGINTVRAALRFEKKADWRCF
jgi:hypothetical protein